jgi:hypothetical protein
MKRSPFKKFIAVLLVAGATLAAAAQESASQEPAPTHGHLKPFESDGCTMFLDGPPGKPKLWVHCCFEHDLRYWIGGAPADMDFTDLELKACVQDAAGKFWANTIYNGVRAGHNSTVRHKYHWSWGWEPERADEPLSAAETGFAIGELGKLPLAPDDRQKFIRKYLRPDY